MRTTAIHIAVRHRVQTAASELLGAYVELHLSCANTISYTATCEDGTVRFSSTCCTTSVRACKVSIGEKALRSCVRTQVLMAGYFT
eukprot:1976432-Rhodomonas_salina.4